MAPVSTLLRFHAVKPAIPYTTKRASSRVLKSGTSPAPSSSSTSSSTSSFSTPSSAFSSAPSSSSSTSSPASLPSRLSVRGSLEFINVCFSYPCPSSSPSSSSSPPVLNNISFSVQAGHTIGIVGPSGAGKSTLVSLVQRFFDPSAGSILLDGQDLRDYDPRELYENAVVGTVFQENDFLEESVEDNIKYGCPSASFEDVVRAAEAANIHEEILRRREGYKSRVATFSGGQRQRISIARTLLRNPKVLLLDEATASLDSISESKVQKALARLMKGRTCLIIAHRLATVVNADSILVLDRGRIVNQGNHWELLARCDLYRSMVSHQQIIVPPTALARLPSPATSSTVSESLDSTHSLEQQVCKLREKIESLQVDAASSPSIASLVPLLQATLATVSAELATLKTRNQSLVQQLKRA
eukprot:GILI01003695.1.p1 GENE.GILI01003695.1~~GILI01003695.1.p1  ORF type:complete len:483 (+),score=109.60 GILI01003695.1:207-1451(+)